MIKRIAIFVGLKIAEIAVVVPMPYYLGKLLCQWNWYAQGIGFIKDGVVVVPYWPIGFLSSIMLIVAGIVVLAIIGAILRANWQWAKRLADK